MAKKKTADEIRAAYAPVLCDRFLVSGCAAYEKRQVAKKKPKGKAVRLNKILADAAPEQIQAIVKDLKKTFVK